MVIKAAFMGTQAFFESRPVCANEKNPALSVDRKPLGTSKRASHPARPVPAFAPHGPRCSADACRSAIGRSGDLSSTTLLQN